MEPWETVTMSRKEARRPGLVRLAVAGKITTAAGAGANFLGAYTTASPWRITL